MKEYHTYENGLKYKPDYRWPKEGSQKDCPRCNESLEIVQENKAYYGKPWWCSKCQWQYSEEDLDKAGSSKK